MHTPTLTERECVLESESERERRKATKRGEKGRVPSRVQLVVADEFFLGHCYCLFFGLLFYYIEKSDRGQKKTFFSLLVRNTITHWDD